MTAPAPDAPTRPVDYATLSVVYGALLSAVALSARGKEPLDHKELVPISAATFALSKLIVHEKVETWIRQPFVEEVGVPERRPKGRRLRYAVGELLTCSRCMGAWSALALVGLRLHAPATGRTVVAVLAVSGGNDALQAAFRWLCEKSTEQTERTSEMVADDGNGRTSPGRGRRAGKRNEVRTDQ